MVSIRPTDREIENLMIIDINKKREAKRYFDVLFAARDTGGI